MNKSEWVEAHKTWTATWDNTHKRWTIQCSDETVLAIKKFIGCSHTTPLGTAVINQFDINDRFEKTPRVFKANNIYWVEPNL